MTHKSNLEVSSLIPPEGMMGRLNERSTGCQCHSLSTAERRMVDTTIIHWIKTLVLSLQLFPPFYQSHDLISNSDWLITFVVAVEMSSVIISTSVWQQCIEYRSIIWQLYVLYRITNSMSLPLKHWPHFEPITGTLPWLFVFSGGDRTTISRLVSRSSRATWHAVSGLSPVIMVSCLV